MNALTGSGVRMFKCPRCGVWIGGSQCEDMITHACKNANHTARTSNELEDHPGRVVFKADATNLESLGLNPLMPVKKINKSQIHKQIRNTLDIKETFEV